MQKKKVVLWGAGKLLRDILHNRCFFEDYVEIVCITDSSNETWGKVLAGVEILPPKCILQMQYDKIVISSDKFFNEIKEYIVQELHIEEGKIENRYYFAKEKLLARYKNSPNPEIREITEYLQEHNLGVFNYSFTDGYRNMEAEIGFDAQEGMHYVIHCGKRMYMSRRLDTKEKVLRYYRSICMEQDEKSPHAYLDEGFNVRQGDVVVDVGVAEGNFALQVIDKASKIYLIETDEDWIDALKCTFAEFPDKVVLVNKFVSDYCIGNTDMLDNIIEEKVDFIKMDVEGCEAEVLMGARNIISRSDAVKCAICAYHRDNDEVSIKNIAEAMGLVGYGVKGYMWYPVGEKQIYISPILRKGVIRYEKKG